MPPASAVRVPVVLLVSCAVLVACGPVSRLRARCTTGDVASCMELAQMYATGTGVPRDVARAAEMYQHACDLGAAETYNTLGEIYERSHEMEGGLRRAEELFRLACTGNSAAGCRERDRLRVRVGLITAAQ